jgi:hypothetical protein
MHKKVFLRDGVQKHSHQKRPDKPEKDDMVSGICKKLGSLKTFL